MTSRIRLGRLGAIATVTTARPEKRHTVSYGMRPDPVRPEALEGRANIRERAFVRGSRASPRTGSGRSFNWVSIHT